MEKLLICILYGRSPSNVGMDIFLRNLASKITLQFSMHVRAHCHATKTLLPLATSKICFKKHINNAHYNIDILYTHYIRFLINALLASRS